MPPARPGHSADWGLLVTAPVLVTRPEAAGRALAARLAKAGFDALWLPAFDLGAAPEPQRVEQALAGLGAFDLVVFVSPAAVRAVASRLPDRWPARTDVAAVGAATAAALRGLPALRGRPILEPPARGAGADAEADGGSEALWPALAPILRRGGAQRALVLRAQHGRDWLLVRLREAGVAAEPLAVYARVPHAIDAQARAWLAQRQHAPIDSVFSSSEAVDTLTEQVAAVSQARAALAAGRALASHPRIAERLLARGYAHVMVCRLEADAIAAALRRA